MQLFLKKVVIFDVFVFKMKGSGDGQRYFMRYRESSYKVTGTRYPQPNCLLVSRVKCFRTGTVIKPLHVSSIQKHDPTSSPWLTVYHNHITFFSIILQKLKIRKESFETKQLNVQALTLFSKCLNILRHKPREETREVEKQKRNSQKTMHKRFG